MPELRIARSANITSRRGDGDSAALQYMAHAFDALMTQAFAAGGATDAHKWVLLGSGVWVLLEPGACVALEPDLELRLVDARFRDGADLDHATVALASERRTNAELAAYLRALVDRYRNGRCGADAREQLVFDLRPARSELNSRVNAHVNQTNGAVARLQRIVSAPRTLGFNKHRFASTKTFANLCGRHVRELERRVAFFLDNEAWYAAKGVPYQLGVMLSGESGTGKSSAIRAIARRTGRHVVSVNLANVSTAGQLKRLFQSDELHVCGSSDDQSEPVPMHVPIHKRLYVLEELDALGAAVLQRGKKASATDAAGQDTAALPDELTLGELLTLLDGGVEMPGRIVVFTTNYPERLDRALVRPGRIDIHVRFGLASAADLAELYAMLYDEALAPELAARLPDGELSPAEASEVLIAQHGAHADRQPERVVEALLEAARARNKINMGALE